MIDMYFGMKSWLWESYTENPVIVDRMVYTVSKEKWQTDYSDFMLLKDTGLLLPKWDGGQ